MSTNVITTKDKSVVVPASPVLFECILLLKSVSSKLIEWSVENPETVKVLPNEIWGIDETIAEAVADIATLIRHEILENGFFKND